MVECKRKRPFLPYTILFDVLKKKSRVTGLYSYQCQSQNVSSFTSTTVRWTPWTTEAQQGCHYGFARDESPVSTTYALECTSRAFSQPVFHWLFSDDRATGNPVKFSLKRLGWVRSILEKKERNSQKIDFEWDCNALQWRSCRRLNEQSNFTVPGQASRATRFFISTNANNTFLTRKKRNEFDVFLGMCDVNHCSFIKR